MIKLKNRTSTVAAERSISNIESLLVKAGANHISKEYTGGKITGFLFQLDINDKPVTFKLPAKIDRIFESFKEDIDMTRVRNIDAKLNDVYQQAERCGWKILYEWVHINLSLIEIDQVKAAEVFLPYIYDLKSGNTLFELVDNGKIKLLN